MSLFFYPLYRKLSGEEHRRILSLIGGVAKGPKEKNRDEISHSKEVNLNDKICIFVRTQRIGLSFMSSF